ncbi:heptaprenylglyceryl phosphate synthase [Marinococcus luteus]|uniref:heptaprenylglyceryl phosphate synthase n=1 Tax=Marinococcus luteus TaxID=1122204 RepID=UPI002ACCCED5|nr:heptaprenylglyceryl phosphate synthase [Marinococcus luteus]MDZ5783293.1 heptaprenylglyceryl phosphate synthase [Marinococcus luteus]
MLSYSEWKHAFKLDPAKAISDEDLEQICESGTDAVIVGGSDGVTLDNTLNLLARVRRFPVACALEISNIEAVTPGFDCYLVPTVLNAGEARWITGLHQQALKEMGPALEQEEVLAEGYCILNPDAKAAALTEARTEQTDEDIEAYAAMADRLFHLPIFYIEYSGTYGDVRMVQEARKALHEARLFYGGGIRSKEQAAEMAAYADTIVVGDIVYENVKRAVQTVRAVRP